MIDIWEAGKWGARNTANAISTVRVYKITASSNKALFYVRPIDDDIYFNSGSSKADIESQCTTGNGNLFPKGTWAPLVVEGLKDCFIGILRVTGDTPVHIGIVSHPIMGPIEANIDTFWTLSGPL